MTDNILIEQSSEEENKWKRRFKNQDLSPELWAAKFGHQIICGDLRKYSFPDKNFQSWTHRIFEILHTDGKVEELRKYLLTSEEQEKIQEEIDDDSFL